MPRTPNRNKKVADTKTSGDYTSRHIAEEDILHHRGTAASAYDAYNGTIVSAVQIGREPSGLTEPSSGFPAPRQQQQYHQQRRPTPEQHQNNYNNQRQNNDDDWEQYERHTWDDNPQSSEPPPRQQFTDLPGPHGTSGQTAPRRMDTSKYGFFFGIIYQNSANHDVLVSSCRLINIVFSYHVPKNNLKI